MKQKQNNIDNDSLVESSPPARLAYKISECSDLLGVSASTLRKMVRRGDLNVITSCGPWLVPTSELDRLMTKTIR